MKVSRFSYLIPIHQKLAKYRVIGMMSITTGRTYQFIYSREKKFLNIHFVNKGLHVIDIANIFRHKSVQANVRAYFKQQAAPIISYTYTSTIASTTFNHRKTL